MAWPLMLVLGLLAAHAWAAHAAGRRVPALVVVPVWQARGEGRHRR